MKNIKTLKILMFCVFWLSLIFLFPFYGNSKTYKPKNLTKCSYCNKTISGRMIKVEGNHYHHDCFTCKKCGKTLSGKFVKDGLKGYHPVCYKIKNGLECSYCSELLEDKWMVYENKKYHKGCLEYYIDSIRPRCRICGKGIDGQYTKDNNGSYHTSCYRKNILPKCSICLSPIENKFLIDAWGNKTHEKHNDKPVKYCSSCSRVISKRTSNGMFEYSDGRIVCGFCRSSAIDDQGTISEYRNEVLEILQTIGFSDLPPDIPVNLVSRKDLIEKSKNRFNGKSKGFTECNTLYLNGKTASLDQKIFILSGLPQLEFKGVLAHETLHTWLNMLQVKMSDNDMEGFCNLGTMEVYKEENSQFAQVLIKSMEKDPDPGYGTAYRKMKKKLEIIGWKNLINRIKNKKISD